MNVKEVNPANSVLFQLANTCLLLSYASKDLLMLRVVLMLAGLFFVLWGSLSLAAIALDTVLWNSIFCLINALRTAQLVWERRPIKFEREEHEEIYEEVFGPVGIGRLQFKELIAEGLMRSLREGSTFIEAGNEATNLSLLYSGRMDIVSAPKDGRPSERVGSLVPMQFVESPQWANIQVQRRKLALGRSSRPSESRNGRVGADDEGHLVEMDVGRVDEDVRKASTVEVTFRASSDITFITWPMEKLQEFIKKRPMVAAPLNSVVGADVSVKLFSQTKAGEEKESIGKRIFMPLDEPTEEAVVPLEEQDEAIDSDEHINVPEEVDKEVADALHLQRPVIDRRNSLIAEKRWLERRGAEDTANDSKLAALLRSRTSLNKFEISALLSKGRWRHIAREGTVLIREGETATFLGIVLEGTLSVSKEDGESTRHLHNILPTQMVGSLELLEAGREHVSGETTVSLQPCTLICWDCDDLRELLAPRPRLRSQLTMLIAMDLAEKFRQVEDLV